MESPEPVLDVVAGRLVEDGGELAAHDLDVPGRDPGHQPTHVQLDRGPPGPLHDHQFGLGAGGQDLGQDPGPPAPGHGPLSYRHDT